MIRVLPFVLPALILHIILGFAAVRTLPYFATKAPDASPMRMVILEPPEEPIEEPELEEPELTGQIVELPEPEIEETPDEAEYLAENAQKVEEETKTDLTEVNPEVLSDKWSPDQKMEQEDLVDVNAEEESTGAQVGNDSFDPSKDGNLAALPSPFAMTNKDGMQKPVPSSQTTAEKSGAPQNDLLNERPDERTALNAREYLYAGYLNRIRRLVNFYWQQNVDNLPSGTRLVKSAYTTGVEVILDGYGRLEVIEIVHASGNADLDGCVVNAFRTAGPFPNPPDGLIEKDGRVYLPSFAFTVRQGQARMRYSGVDPRAGVQFPGIMKSPR